MHIIKLVPFDCTKAPGLGLGYYKKKEKHKVTLFSQHTSAGPFIIPIDESI